MQSGSPDTEVMQLAGTPVAEEQASHAPVAVELISAARATLQVGTAGRTVALMEPLKLRPGTYVFKKEEGYAAVGLAHPLRL